jgi:hypothetical protein
MAYNALANCGSSPAKVDAQLCEGIAAAPAASSSASRDSPSLAKTDLEGQMAQLAARAAAPNRTGSG